MTRTRQLKAAVFALLLATSLVAGVIPASAIGAPDGMVGIPDSNVREDLPAQAGLPGATAFQGSVMTSRHADTLEVSVTTEGRAFGQAVADQARNGAPPKLAIQLTDNEHSQGRRVALPVEPIRNATGRVPHLAYVSNDETGEEWALPVERQGSLLVIEVPHFSTNTITWSGLFTASGTYTDGSSFTYDQASEAGNYSINVTGHTAYETDTVSGTYANGDSAVLSVAGTKDPTTAEVTFTGDRSSLGWNNQSASGLSIGSSQSLAMNGNVEPTGAGGGDPEVSVTGHPLTSTDYSQENQWVDAEGGSVSTMVPAPMATIDRLELRNQYVSPTLSAWADIEVYINGTLIGSRSQVEKGDTDTFTNVGYDASGTSEVEISVTVTQYRDPGTDHYYFRDDSVSSPNMPEFYLEGAGPQSITVSDDTGKSVSLGAGGTGTIDLQPSSSSLTLDATGTGTLDYTLQKEEWEQTDSPSVDVNGDGTPDASYSGLMADGETATYDVTSALSLSSSSMDVTTAGHTVGVDLSYQEVTETVDPVIEVNGNTTSHSGTLADGEEVSLTADSNWVEQGTNRVNVSVTPSVSADAPAPQVDLDYRHDGTDKSDVAYDAEKWSERYNVSKTFAQDQSSASLTIPFDGRVIEIRDLTVYKNGGEVSPTSQGFSGTTLEVGLGTVAAGDTVRVVANGTKVSAYNASITVTEPTQVGDALDSKVQLDSWNGDSYINVGGTPDGTRVHYTTNESWSSPSAFARIAASGDQNLHFPNAGDGSTFRVTTLPIRVEPEGDVDIAVEEPSQTEPTFSVDPGTIGGQAVSYTFLDAVGGTDYILYSLDNGRVEDQGTAQSPLTLVDDDSSDTLQFQIDDGGSETTDTDGGGTSLSGAASSAAGSAASLVARTGIIGVVAALFAAAWLFSRSYGSNSITTRQFLVGEGLLIGLLALETLSPASLVGGFFGVLGEFFGQAGAGVATAMPLLILVGGGLAYYYLRQRGKPEKVVNFKLGGGSN
ncbi:hypothetical protein ACFQH6_19365 [Halobacteriaceae archaeon GCM10025711]